MKPFSIACFSVLAFGVAGAAVAAEEATLADAAEHGNRARIGKLLDAGTDVNAPQVDGTTALHWAVYRDDAETAALLVRAGADATRRTAMACRRYLSPRRTAARTS